MKIPPHAVRVFQGLIFDTYQWEQKMFDGSVQTFEMAKRQGTVFCIPITTDNNILIIKELQPHYDDWRIGFIGGRIEHNEDPVNTVKRELLEETGYSATNFSLYEEVISTDKKLQHSISTYIATGCTPTQEPQLDPGGEKIEVISCDFDEFLEFRHHPLASKSFKTFLYSLEKNPNKKQEFLTKTGLTG